MKNLIDPHSKELTFEQKMEYEKLMTERLKARNELIKWVLIAIGAIISFWIIDIGKLKLEKLNAESIRQQKLLDSYLTATEASNPDLWKRKLKLIKNFAKDSLIAEWTRNELAFIKEKAALLSLYKETVNVASIIANRETFRTPEWNNATKRFYQLYWADLPFYGESDTVISRMIAFKTQLDAIGDGTDPYKWKLMDLEVIRLSGTMKSESAKLDPDINFTPNKATVVPQASGGESK